MVLETAATVELLWYLAMAVDRRSVDEGRSVFMGGVARAVDSNA